MTASSVTGVGTGSVKHYTTHELGGGGPQIVFTGITTVEGGVSSPPGYDNEVTFPYALPGGANGYVVLLTTIGGGYSYVVDRDENDSGEFTGFKIVAEADCSIMYLVAKVGFRQAP